jgi:hypothetical protein
MDLDRDEKRLVLSLKREKPSRHPRHDALSEGKQGEAKTVEGKEATAYAQPYLEEEEGWTDLGWLGWPSSGGLSGFGGARFNGVGLPFSNVVYVTQTQAEPRAWQAAVCAVPEPSVPMMLFTGVVSLAAIQWLRRRCR